MGKIQLFLDRLSIIESKYRTLEDSKEQFNIFTALHTERDERRLHSRFLSVVLSPGSSHKKGDLFLKHFLQVLSINDFDLGSIKVYPTEYEKSEYKKIDLLIINRSSRQAIIIENKIDAGDSNHEDRGQLEGYVNRICNEDHIPQSQIKVLYLTLDGHEPSKESLGQQFKTLEEMNGRTISYEKDILNWLDLCLRDCVSQAFLRESLLQYIKLIKHMTNNEIDNGEGVDLFDLIGKTPDNLKSTKFLIDNFIQVKQLTIKRFYTELEEELKKEGYRITQSETENRENEFREAIESKNYKKSEFGFYIETKELTVYIWNNNYRVRGLFWGMKKENIPTKYKDKICNFFQESSKEENPGENNDVCNYFYFEKGEKINFSDFSCQGTFNLINNTYRKTIIEKLVKEIKSFVDQIVED